ncbi:MAG: hypothetical protein ACP5PZ_04210 [Bacteroidales bacterium]
MANFSRIERWIAQILRNIPWLKTFLKKNYQTINYFLFKEKITHQTSLSLQVYEYENCETFFGYYDKSPENSTGEFIIYHASDYPTHRLPSPTLPIKIVLQNIKKNTHHVFLSYAYNWQQGSKLQWIDTYYFVFNDFDAIEQRYVSKIVDANNASIVKILPFPVYDVFKNTVLYLNFSRLNVWGVDYGYRNIIQRKFDDDNDGIFIGNINSETSQLLYSISLLKSIAPFPDNCKHTVNHIIFSPAGDKFIFIHRYFHLGRRYDRLMLGFIDGRTPISLSRYTMVSHYFWLDNNKIVAFLKDKAGDRYYILDTQLQKIEPYPLEMPNISVLGDGHPNVYNKKMIFDTYPNKSRMKLLYLFDMQDNELIFLGKFFEPLRYYGQTRCDLHPRWNFLGNRIYIDSTHTFRRQLYYLIYDK